MTPLLLAIPFVLAAPVPKDFRKAVPKLDGTWRCAGIDIGGRAWTGDIRTTWTFDGERLSVVRSLGARDLTPTEVLIRTAADRGPMAFDYTVVGSGRTILGAFAVEGDTLTLCLNNVLGPAERPTTLDGGPGIAKYTLKRVER